ncbi:MAG: hypothetical protein KGL31_00905 [candidate division NC10 bacterium]|nr:hypothetical protein [candidate division NC10 bacterium]
MPATVASQPEAAKQQLRNDAGDFRDETFRFQVLDEGEYADRDWRDTLKKLLDSAV